MKKIFIVSACAFALCLTSCASKQAPETDTSVDAPQTENTQTENEEAEDTSENTES